MKIRKGFVSNSSSSSFVIAFDREPRSIDEVRDILFGDFNTFEFYDEIYDSRNIADAVFGQLNHPATEREILESISNGWFPGHPDCDKFRNSEGNIDWDARDAECDRLASKIKNKFMKENKGKVFYVVSFSDSTSFGSACEHGEIFNKISHIRTSYH